jgi:aryl-alcohol dehydrogenase-like predicted oxidoreductase
MEYRRLGATELRVSGLGLGTVELGMPYGLGLPTPPGDQECIDLLRRAYDLGITYFDTAAAYGRSEELLGRTFAGASERPVIATKTAIRARPDARPLQGTQLRRHVEESVARSLRLLGVDALDLVQVHNSAGPFVTPGLVELMEELRGRGWVRHWGASTYGRDDALHLLENAEHFESLQVAHSALDRRLAADVLPACRRHRIGVVLRSVFLKGVLSDRYRALPDVLEPLRRAARQLEAVAVTVGTSLSSLALRFAAFSSWGHVTLVGTASLAELEANLAAYAAGPLPPEASALVQAVVVPDDRLLNPANWES